MQRLFLTLALTSCLLQAQPPNPIEALKRAQWLMKKHDLNGAYKVVREAAAQAPESPIMLTALGRIDFLRGEIGPAEMEFKKAIKLDEKYGQAWLGLGRVFESASLRRQAKLCYLKAHEVAPQDGEIESYYSRLLTPQMQLAQLEKMLESSAGEDSDDLENLRRRVAQLKATGDHETFALASPNAHTEVKLSYLLFSPNRMRGFALPVSLNGGKTVKLLMDTGAGGILLNRKAAEAAGLVKISDMKFGGIGDQGDRTGYTALAEKVKIGDVEFTNCPIGVTERKFLTDEDGLIGTDVFSHFLVTLDFQQMVVKLDPLPKHQTPGTNDSFWEDREVAPEFKEFTPFFRYGHDILLVTRVNDSKPVLFLVDTGATNTLIDPDFAHDFTKVRSEDLMKMKGVSGNVDKVQTADAVKLEFGHYRQPYRDVLSIPLTKVNEDGPQMTGIMGVPTLIQFRMQIDYRDGLINLIYIGQK